MSRTRRTTGQASDPSKETTTEPFDRAFFAAARHRRPPFGTGRKVLLQEQRLSSAQQAATRALRQRSRGMLKEVQACRDASRDLREQMFLAEAGARLPFPEADSSGRGFKLVPATDALLREYDGGRGLLVVQFGVSAPLQQILPTGDVTLASLHEGSFSVASHDPTRRPAPAPRHLQADAVFLLIIPK